MRAANRYSSRCVAIGRLVDDVAAARAAAAERYHEVALDVILVRAHPDQCLGVVADGKLPLAQDWPAQVLRPHNDREHVGGI